MGWPQTSFGKAALKEGRRFLLLFRRCLQDRCQGGMESSGRLQKKAVAGDSIMTTWRGPVASCLKS
jgi:hypothetical protein